MTLCTRLAEYVSACFTGLWVQCSSTTTPSARSPRCAARRTGGWRPGTSSRACKFPASRRPARRRRWATTRLAAIRSINALASADSSAILVLANFHRFLSVGRNRAGPGPADHPRKEQPHFRSGPFARGANPQRNWKSSSPWSSMTFPAAQQIEADRPRHGHRGGRIARRGRS